MNESLASAAPKGARRRKAEPGRVAVETLFLVCACISILAIVTITIYIFISGMPAMFKIGVFNFLFGTEWQPKANEFGLLPMILTSLLTSGVAVIVGSAIGILTAVFLAELAPKWLAAVIRPCVELLAGIPSIVYGYFGLVVVVPLISQYLGGRGNSMLAVMIILSVMILPTIINISLTSLKAVPMAYKEGSLALGASHVQTIFKTMIPAARSGILASVVLGIGRAIGETMAVILVAGNAPQMPVNLLIPVRTITINIAFEMNYATGLHREALFATGVVLFVIIMLLNLALTMLLKKREAKA